MSSISPLLSHNEWQQFFPRAEYEDYAKKTDRDVIQKVRGHTLKYLIALDQPDDKIVPFISGRAREQEYQSVFTEYNFSVLHIAVLKNRVNLIEPLIEKGANPDAKDVYGWTPLHHAALVSEDIFAKLISLGAKEEALNRLGGTPQDIRLLTDYSKDAMVPKLYYRGEGDEEDQEVPVELFQSLTRIQYTNQIKFPKESWRQLWETNPDNSAWILDKEYIDMYREPVRAGELAVRSSPVLKGVSSLEYGVYARAQLPSNVFVLEYTGESRTLSHNERYVEIFERLKGGKLPDPYDYEDITAQKLGNVARFINDGWPSLIPMRCSNQRGFSNRIVFRTIKEISVNEELLYDYGANMPMKWGRYAVQHFDEIVDFCKVGPMELFRKHETYQKEDMQRPEGHPSHEKARPRFGKLMYCLNTPAVLLRLVLDKPFPNGSANRWLEVLGGLAQDKCLSQSLFGNFIVYRFLSIKMLYILRTFEEIIFTDESQEEIISFFLEKMKSHTVVDVVTAIYKTVRWNKKENRTSWHDYKQELESFFAGNTRDDPENFVTLCILAFLKDIGDLKERDTMRFNISKIFSPLDC